MEELNLALQEIFKENPLVGYWLNWMGFIMFASVIFVWKHVPARFVLGVFILLIPVGLLIFSLSGSAHLIGIGHLIFWTPLAYYLYNKVITKEEFKTKTFYGVWVWLVLITIGISLVFDVRDVILVSLGQK